MDSGSFINTYSVSASLPVVLTIVFYSLYWFVASSVKLKERINSIYESIASNVIYVILKRSVGFLILGVVPVTLSVILNDNYTLADVGLVAYPDKTGFNITSVILLSLILIPIVFLTARKPAVYSLYPEIRASQWTGGLLFAELITWAVYLLGYEALFRGVLLFGLARTLGPVTATVINVILYSAAHLPKGKTETLASIPFGVALCILTLHSGTIWIAYSVHLVNALTITLTAIRFNPEMKLHRSNPAG